MLDFQQDMSLKTTRKKNVVLQERWSLDTGSVIRKRRSCQGYEAFLKYMYQVQNNFSPFLGEMREKQMANVPIVGIDPTIMRQLIDYAYTSDITIHQDNAQHLLSAANMVQIISVREACCRFLEKEMDPGNCLGIHCFAEAHMCMSLAQSAKEYTLEHFSEVAKHSEILLLPQKKLIEFIQEDELVTTSEEVVLQVVLDWARYDPDRRTSVLSDVLQYVRLPLVSPYFLFDKITSEPLLSGNAQCRPLLDEAMKYYILKVRERKVKFLVIHVTYIFGASPLDLKSTLYKVFYVHLC